MFINIKNKANKELLDFHFYNYIVKQISIYTFS